MTPDPNRSAKFTSKSGRHFLNANGPSFNTHVTNTQYNINIHLVAQ